MSNLIKKLDGIIEEATNSYTVYEIIVEEEKVCLTDIDGRTAVIDEDGYFLSWLEDDKDVDEEIEGIDEVKMKRVVRAGKIVKKADCPPGQIYDKGKKRCRKQTGKEKRTAKIAGKKRSRTAKAHKAQAKKGAVKRARSMKKVRK